MDGLDDCLSFLIAKAAQQVTRRFREALTPFGVTPVQYAVLHLLWDKDGLSGAEICERLGLDSASVTGVADRMEGAGLVERRDDPAGDRRITRLHLTARGNALRSSSLGDTVDALNREIAAELGAQAPRFWETLRRLGRGASRPGDSAQKPARNAGRRGRGVAKNTQASGPGSSNVAGRRALSRRNAASGSSRRSLPPGAVRS